MVLPGAVSQQNPYTYGVDFTSTNPATVSASAAVSAAVATEISAINGVVVQNFASAVGTNTSSSLDQSLRVASLQTQQTAANLAQMKLNGPQIEIMPQTAISQVNLGNLIPALRSRRSSMAFPSTTQRPANAT